MTDAIERAARAVWESLHPFGWSFDDISAEAKAAYRHDATVALASLRPGDKITLADGTECWIAPMEATEAMRTAAVAADDKRTGNETCAHIFRAMRDACKQPKALKRDDDLSDYHEPDASGYSRADEEWFFDAEGRP